MEAPLNPDDRSDLEKEISGLREKALTSARMHAIMSRTAEQDFVAGETYIPPSGKVIGAQEIANAVSAVLEQWWTEGHWVDDLERAVASYVGVRCASMTNSGSSANLLAVSALTSDRMPEQWRYPTSRKDKRHEQRQIITPAVGFPTTLNPIFQNNFLPVLTDVELGTYLPSVKMIEDRISVKTAAILLPHTLGNVGDMKAIRELCKTAGIALIEDNCDALGSEFDGKRTGGFGLMATQSFYPAHHITTGEGGMVLTPSPRVKKVVESFRDWGRDCWCPPGEENTCGKRFDWDFSSGEWFNQGLPHGYDHKYVYSEIGYNLKSTDLQAAIGCAQIERIAEFTEMRRQNFAFYKNAFRDLDEFLILPERGHDLSKPSWFGFPITVRDDAPFTRDDLVHHLTEMEIGTRNMFGGNLLAQPAYDRWAFIHGTLKNADKVARSSFWIGVYPGITPKMREYVAEVIHQYVKERQISAQSA